MVQYLVIIILALCLVLLSAIIVRLRQEKKDLQKTISDCEKCVRRNRSEEQYLKSRMQLTQKNCLNLLKYVNTKMCYFQTCGHQQYFKIYQKELSASGSEQTIYALFFEDDFIYDMEYLQKPKKNFDISIDVTRFCLQCKIFVDGDELDPSLNESISKEDRSFGIEELNMRKHKGKGVGSFYLECLCKELQRYPQIRYICGELSQTDYSDKDRLINFYSKNGFDDIKPMTKNSWGHIKKTLRTIDDDVLKLKHKQMTFGIEIEFQLKNGIQPQTIAQGMVRLGLSDCEEVRTFDTISDIKGWKIIKEKTCECEIISPILTDTERCWEQINLVCALLARNGAYADDNCALHIHVGTEGLLSDGTQWVALREIYKQLEPLTCALAKGEVETVSHNRLTNHACTIAMADKTLWCKGMTIDQCLEAIQAGRIDLVQSFYPVRRVGMNWNEAKQTIEFRLFNGTINFSLIQLYLMYMCNLADKAASKKTLNNNICSSTIIAQREITSQYIDASIDFLTDDTTLNNKLKQSMLCRQTLDDFTWDMLSGNGEIPPP